MSGISFHTNLDEAKQLVLGLCWDWRGPVPSVGHGVDLPLANKKILRLRVMSVVWDRHGAANVELHMWQSGMSVAEWSEWFRRLAA